MAAVGGYTLPFPLLKGAVTLFGILELAGQHSRIGIQFHQALTLAIGPLHSHGWRCSNFSKMAALLLPPDG
jgi:hypothetical protein